MYLILVRRDLLEIDVLQLVLVLQQYLVASLDQLDRTASLLVKVDEVLHDFLGVYGSFHDELEPIVKLSIHQNQIFQLELLLQNEF